MSLPLVDHLAVELGKEALTGLLGVVKIIASSKTWGKELKEKLLSVKPTIDKISQKISDSDTSPDRGNQFQDFQVVLQEGIDMVETLEKIHSFDIFRKYRYGKKIRKFQRKVSDFLVTQVPLNIALDVQKQDADFKNYFQRFESEIKNAIAGITNNPISNTIMLQQINTTQVCQTSSDAMHETTAAQQAISCASQVPDVPKFVVGLDNPINDVKQILLQNDVNVLGIAGLGGSGKTTLASALCKDTEVNNFFQNNIIFITVSQLDNVNCLSEILEVMWDKLIGVQMPHFRSIEDAHNQLSEKLKLRKYRPTLVVLDDAWCTSDLEPLLFEAEGYKTIITTRQDSTIRITDSTRCLYKMNMLEETNALSLFCFWAFSTTSIPTTAKEDLVKQVAAECKGLPLALKVIGSCLHGEPQPLWRSAKEKLSRAEDISESHREQLLNRLEMSIGILDDVQKQCFLDLGAFPEGRKLSVDSLLDIWVYVRGMEWDDAFVVLFELAKRNLINLTGNPGSGALEYRCASELCFSQHDVMRDLALRLASKDSIVNRKRLFMPRKEGNVPADWKTTLINQSSGAQFLSIHTGAMQEQAWCQIQFPEVEALALFFSAEQYCLPTFLQTMPKLKVLILYNYSSRRATLSGLPSFPSPVQIRSVHLNKLRVPPLYDNCRSWEMLEKLYVCLCEGLGNIGLLDRQVESLNFPKIKEINIDHCSDLKELPAKLCNLTSLQILSVTNCHLIQNFPDDLGRLSSLRVLRLSTCPTLLRLPPSICNLGKLEYLDISLCGYLKDLPSNFDQLSNLEMLDMRECSGLKKLHKIKLKSLKRVRISDPEMEGEWLSIPNLTVDVVVERFSLDWLDDD